MMKFSETSAFSKDLKRLSKKYKSLPNDVHEFKKVVAVVPCGSSKHFVILRNEDEVRIIKARLFCRYLRGTSLRVVYAYDARNEKITFIELYFKGDQERENDERIEAWFKLREHNA